MTETCIWGEGTALGSECTQQVYHRQSRMMTWLRRIRMRSRTKNYFRFGILTYLIFLLLLFAVWTFMLLVPDVDHLSHLHHKVSHGHHDDDIIIVKRNPKLAELAVFRRHEYDSNHTHPVLDEPPVVNGTHNASGCPTVHVVDFFGQSLALTGEPLCHWLTKPFRMADNHFVMYGSEMALLYDVVVDPSLRGSGPQGGEEMDQVWGQDEQKEYLMIQYGFFTMQCKSKPMAKFGQRDHLNSWQQALRCVDDIAAVKTEATVAGLTIAIQRYEYVNFYHTMTDYFNAFLAMLAFNQHPDAVTILWVDAHPRGGLDEVWEVLFGKVLRAGRLPGPTRFSALAWAVMGYNSPLSQHGRESVPYLEEFRHFFLSRHGVDGSRKLNCTSLSFLFIWRRDYVAHPRNKGGIVSRKIYNEAEVLKAVQSAASPADRVRGLQLDALPMKEQLSIIVDTDILLGMHGAGLSHTLFLPPHGALLEFFPTYWSQANVHFRRMAGWRGLHYQTWENIESENEKDNMMTFIPPQVVSDMVRSARNSICSGR
ncbi:beta-(1,2)-xylosyltransferase-like isoform X3 [Pomacea canaliculata]|uniref:beta-(1,2)-xylosyltransferase-like isoform X3 n=1 Tax=Pomacea canaliculata TaxID=400727 RepID=UPI000D739D14|nr:beta-(1,2)-xylosyltransferase-like isoform X3 [Pomacea canaliculata]